MLCAFTSYQLLGFPFGACIWIKNIQPHYRCSVTIIPSANKKTERWNSTDLLLFCVLKFPSTARNSGDQNGKRRIHWRLYVFIRSVSSSKSSLVFIAQSMMRCALDTVWNQLWSIYGVYESTQSNANFSSITKPKHAIHLS